MAYLIARPMDCEHQLETHCDTEINGAGVHCEYWQVCTKCERIFLPDEPLGSNEEPA